MGVREVERFLKQWQMEVKDLRRRMILAPTPRERERWYAMLLLVQGWTAAATAEAQQAELRAAVRELPAEEGIGLANWNWKVVHRLVRERWGVSLSRSSCLNYPRLHGGRLCTAWDLPSSVPRSAWSRLMRPSGRGLRGGVRRPVGRGGTLCRKDILCRRGPLPG